MSVADEDKSNSIDFNEFCKTIEKFLSYKPPTPTEGKAIFKVWYALWLNYIAGFCRGVTRMEMEK